MRRIVETSALFCALFVASCARGFAQSAPIGLAFDGRDLGRNVLHVRETIPVNGPLALVLPKWIPGEHGPDGSILELVDLRMTAGGKPVAFTRDTLDNFTFHVAVPSGARSLEVTFDHLYAPEGDSTTPHLATINWVDGVLSPDGAEAHDLMVAPSLTLPTGVDFGTALVTQKSAGTTTTFAPVSLETLVDSPVLAGQYVKKLTLWSGDGRVNQAVLAADAPASLDLKESTVTDLKNLVVQEDAAFGARHWRNYHFLIALADPIAHFGLEHHESSDDRLPANTLTDANALQLAGGLLPHEFFHSWNGKYRRPAGLATPNYQVPMKDELLWVYEGLTNYYGDLLAFRSGFRNVDDYPDFVANVFAGYATQPGRLTRPVVDTAIAIPVARGSSGTYPGLRRGSDYYGEGGLVWLEADQLIRSQTKGTKSLDDFLHVFHGGPSDTPPAVVPYTRGDVIAAMNAVLPYDWKTFFDTHIDRVQPVLDTAGLTNSGWRLIYNDKPNAYIKLRESSSRFSGLDARYSLGAQFTGNGRVIDVFPNMPAARAGLAPGMKILAVNGAAFSPDVLRSAIKDAAGNAKRIALIADNAGFVKLATVDYHAGEKYPHLERIPNTPDYLMASAQPKAAVR